jgi:uncharacterized protein (DUF1684 family)
MNTLVLTMTLLLNAAPGAGASRPAASDDVAASTREWHEKRIRNLTSEDGWLTLVGLDWMEEGENSAGSAPDSKLVFPAPVPAKLGTFTRKGTTVSLQPAPGVALTLKGKPFTGGVLRSDAEGEPDVLKLGSVSFFVILRGEKLGVRIKDAEAQTRKAFHGIPTYPASAAWRIEARFEPADKPRMLKVPNVLGVEEEMQSPGTLVFTAGGKEHRLTPVLEDGGKQLFIIFGDETNRDETYGAGRFLYADVPKDGRVVLDFNRAYNPPCAFTRFATCPLPPRGNRLAVRVEAGEKRYGDH